MNNSLADSIEKLMEKQGLNTAELANILGVPKATLHKIVTGKSARPRSKTLQALSEYFNVPVAQMLHGEIDAYTQRDKIKNVPIIDWDNITHWLEETLKKNDFQQSTPTNLELSDKSFALIFNEINSPLFRPGSVLLFDPVLEVKDGTYVLVKLFEHPDILLRQIVCDASNTKHLKSLNQEFSASTKKLEANDQIIAILVMAKTLFYHK